MGKYNYMKDYELAAKHGVTPQQYAVDSSKVWALTNIANELAEANRLKRLELRIECMKIDIPKTKLECEEDRA